ncbi:MAG: hypothetical protein WCI41_00490 [bacterium]
MKKSSNNKDSSDNKNLIFCALLLLIFLLVIIQVFLINQGHKIPSLVNCSLLQITMIYISIFLIKSSEDFKLPDYEEEGIIGKKEISFKEKFAAGFVFLAFALIINAIPTLTTLLSFYYKTQHNIVLGDILKNPFTKANNFPFVFLQTTKDASFTGIIIGVFFWIIIWTKNMIKDFIFLKKFIQSKN